MPGPVCSLCRKCCKVVRLFKNWTLLDSGSAPNGGCWVLAGHSRSGNRGASAWRRSTSTGSRRITCARAGLGKPALLKAAAQIGARDVPVTLLHGRADAVCRPANALRLQAVMPQARLVWVPGGHLPAGAMAEALRAAIRAADWQR